MVIENVKKSEKKTDAWNFPAVSAVCCEWILLGFIVRETPATFTLMWERPGHSGKKLLFKTACILGEHIQKI